MLQVHSPNQKKEQKSLLLHNQTPSIWPPILYTAITTTPHLQIFHPNNQRDKPKDKFWYATFSFFFFQQTSRTR
jgi:hypothetical protein